MTVHRFAASEVALVPGGTRELFRRLDDMDETRTLRRAPAVVLREHDRADEWFVIDPAGLREVIRYRSARPGAPDRSLTEIVGIRPANVVAGTVSEGDAPAVMLDARGWPIYVYVRMPGGARGQAKRSPGTGGRVRGNRGAFGLGDRRTAGGEAKSWSPAPEAEPSREPFIQRTPHMDAPDQLPTTRDATFEVSVWTGEAAASAYEEAQDLLIEAPADVDRVTVVVLLSATEHFDVGDAYAQELVIERGSADSERRTFTVRVADPDAAGEAGVAARLLYRGRSCGRVRRTWSWPDGKALAAPAEPPAPVAVHTEAVAPDISVLITADVNDGIQYSASVRIRGLHGWEAYSKPEPWAMKASAEAMVDEAMKGFFNRSLDDRTRQRELRKAGRAFWKAAPPVFRRAMLEYFATRGEAPAGGRPTLYVTSDEPVLPWEIMLPAIPRPDGGEDDRPAPLGVEFAIGRWVHSASTSPPQLLPVSDSVLLAAEYEVESRKLDPSEERAALQRISAVVEPETVTYDSLDAFFGEHDASLVHFVCHGTSTGGKSAILLDGDQACSAEDVRDSTGMQRACKVRKPFVFLNACEVGKLGTSIAIGGAGFPRAFSELGARAVIAPLWPVTKFNSPMVAKAIYERAAEQPDTPVAAIVAELRAKSYTTEGKFDDTWAAYCFYGDPCARLTVDP